jgi:hypothetical protein
MGLPTISIIGDSTGPFALVGSPQRSIGTIIPDIVTREVHNDETVITQHPVETGAPISDHAYLQPPVLEMHCRFSNSTAQSEGYVQLVYQEFLSLQAQLQPFNVTTGKRQYQNMMISGLQVTTDEFTEFVLDLVVHLRGVIITTATQGTSSPMSNSSSSAQTDPQQTGDVLNNGVQQLENNGSIPPLSQVTSVGANADQPGLTSGGDMTFAGIAGITFDGGAANEAENSGVQAPPELITGKQPGQ